MATPQPLTTKPHPPFLVVWNGTIAKETGRQPNGRPSLDLYWRRVGDGTEASPQTWPEA